MKRIDTKYISTIGCFLLWGFCLSNPAYTQTLKFFDQSSSDPVAFVTVKLDGDHVRRSDESGALILPAAVKTWRLEISHVHYRGLDTLVSAKSARDTIRIGLSPSIRQLEDVHVYTGYQQLSAREHIGSTDGIDEQAIQKRTAPNILDRLEGMLSGVTFDRAQLTGNMTNNMRVRGLSSINGNQTPLIVLDDFPYEGELASIDPQNIENITVLKDAAASAIWGARAGNGVIVITTKKAKMDRPISISFNTVSSVSSKPDIRYAGTMEPNDFIEVERYLFDQGYYDAAWDSDFKPGLTPAIELLQRHRDGNLNEQQLEAELRQLGDHNLYDDLEKYSYKKTFVTQNRIGFQGGTQKYGWNISLSQNNMRDALGSVNNRYALQGNQIFQLTDWMSLSLSTMYTQRADKSGRQGISSFGNSAGNVYPYARLADDAGNALPLVRTNRLSYLDELDDTPLLDWKYYPLDDYRHERSTRNLREVLFAPTLSFKLPFGFGVQLKYTYQRQDIDNATRYGQDSFFARDLINRFSQISADGVVSRAVPLGGILSKGKSQLTVNNFRGQLDYNKDIGDFQINMIGGLEARSGVTEGDGFRVYGYNDDLYTYSNIDPTRSYPTFVTGFYEFIPFGNSLTKRTNRFLSYYGNANIKFLGKYAVMASARKDASNFFGVNANRRWNPLWSIGAAWDISKETFFTSDWLPLLKVRASYGASGNMAYNMVAATTIQYRNNSSQTNTPVAEIANFENPDLQWEVIKTLNGGVDFEALSRRLNGSIDVYLKKGDNLFGPTPIDYTRGVGNTITKNVAAMKGYGIDLKINSINLNGHFKWRTGLMLSFNRDEITDYYISNTYGSNFVGKVSTVSGLVGKPVYSMMAYQWAGLDPQDGSPRGYLNGDISKDYALITSTGTDVEDMAYIGTTMPTYFGALNNQFSWGAFSADIGLTYKLGHYLRRATIEYNSLVQNNVTHSDYELRWQNPGDEVKTDIPAFMYPNTVAMQAFYTNAEPFVYRASFVRLQYINLAYSFAESPLFRAKIKPEIYINVENPGILWRQNKYGLDPEAGLQNLGSYPAPAVYSFGLRLIL